MSQLSPDQHARIKAALGKSARQRLADTDLWPAIEQQAQAMPLPITNPAPLLAASTPTNQPHRAPRFSPATAVIAIAVLMVVGLLTSALLPAFTQPAPIAAPVASNSASSAAPGSLLISTPYTITVPYQEPGDINLMSAVMAQRAQPVDISKTINGYTLTINKVYADANVIMVRCSISGANQAAVDYDTIALSSGPSAVRNDGVMDSFSGKKGSPSECALQFDATTLNANASNINLRLSANLIAHPDISNLGANAPIPAKQTLAGPFVFDFNVVVGSDIRIVNVGQTVEAQGIAFTMERLIITPGETRMVVRYTLPDANPSLLWNPIIAAEGANWATSYSDNYPRYQGSMDIKSEGPGSQLADGSAIYQITGNLYDKTGPWTVTVKQLHSADKTTDKDQYLTGPWVFQFNVPAN